MREVLIRYNPYKVETEVKIDGVDVKSNSKLNVRERRLQEWVENLPDILVEECNTKKIKVKFQGTLLDYEDLLTTVERAKEKNIELQCEHIVVQEAKDKEKSIKKIFEQIQNGPFVELKEPDLVRAFELAASSDFEVNVVATMSAGKSTLINALLRKKLMPAKQEACTATITKIRDKNLDKYEASIYDANEELIKIHKSIDVNIMNELNNEENVSTIKIDGNIPFVESEETSLVLVDTPGPNNSRDIEHKKATYRMLSESSKTVVLYVLNATQLAVNDDNDLLNHVANSMSVGGKQSKDRFIFVVNKLDNFKEGEDSVENAIEKVRKYLEDKGISRPNIYPAAALPALEIRTLLKDIDINKISLFDDDIDPEVEEVLFKIKKINRSKQLHLEKYAPLTPSIRERIDNELLMAKNSKEKALIHTGIISIEAAIGMYVAKYARTAKIKNIVDTFSKKLESTKMFEKTKQEIALNKDKKEAVSAQINSIKKKLNSGNEAKLFKEKVEKINYDKEFEAEASKVLSAAQFHVRSLFESMVGSVEIEEAKEKLEKIFNSIKNLEIEIQLNFENILNNHIKKNIENLLEQYKKKIMELTSELNFEDIEIKTFELIEGDINLLDNVDVLINKLAFTKNIKVGEEKVKNINRKWYKPWTLFQAKYKIQDIKEDREFIDALRLSATITSNFEEDLYINYESAMLYTKNETKRIKDAFKKKFDELDCILNKKLDELNYCTSEETDINNKINIREKNLAWLENIQMSLEKILEI